MACVDCQWFERQGDEPDLDKGACRRRPPTACYDAEADEVATCVERRSEKRPSFNNGCPFCQMLASRGFKYLSEAEAGGDDPHHYHDDCRCAIVPSWDRSPKVAGYDPKAYQEGYREWLDADHSKHVANKATLEGIRRGNLSPDSESVADVPAGLWGAINLAYNSRFKDKRHATIAYGDYLYEFRIDDYGEYRHGRRWRII